jgi:hypothetical protein
MSDQLRDERLTEIRGMLTVAAGPEYWSLDRADLHDAVRELLAEVERLRDAEPFFKPGHTYRSENGYFDFTCERILDGLAVGREIVVKGFTDYWPVGHGTNVWKSVRAEGCWTDAAGEAS